MRLNVFFAGLLGFASSPMQGLVTARAVGDWNPAVSEARDITARGFDWPTLKKKDISDDVRDGMGSVTTVNNDKGREVLKVDSVYVKTRGDPEHELEVYKDLKGTDFSIEVLAVIVDDDDDDKAIGFVQTVVDGVDATKDDLEACKVVLGKFHDAGWLHMDAHKGNFKNNNGNWLIYDFEDAKRPNDESAYDDDDEENERKEKDFVRQKSNFENPFGWAKN